MAEPAIFDDQMRVDALKAHERVLKFVIIPILCAVGCASGVGLSVWLKTRHVETVQLTTAIIGVAGFLLIVAPFFVYLAWWARKAKRLRTRGVVELRREHADVSYRRFLTIGPIGLIWNAAAACLLIFNIQQAPPSDFTHLKIYTVMQVVLVTLILIGGASHLALLVGGKQLAQDELVAAHRARALSVGFITAVICSFALLPLILFAPRAAAVAAPLALFAPIIVAMSRFGQLERAAARE